MSLRDSIPVLDVRNLSPTLDAERVLEWAKAHPDGFLNVADSMPGAMAERLSWSQCDALARAWAFRAYMQRRGVPARFSVGWRYDVLAPTSSPFTSPDPALEALGFENVVARSRGFRWLEALDAFTAAGWAWKWPGQIAPAFLRALPADAAVYVLSTTVDVARRELELSGVLSAPLASGFAEWAASHARRTLEAFGADALVVGAKPWLRAGSSYHTPTTIDRTGGLIQPTPYARRGSWEAGVSACLVALAAADVPFVTLTRPSTPALVELIGDASASAAALGEADLTVFT
ncbi:MAG: hypothetical protein DCC71_15455 [Proteobacteria bacterium]|nr:MAG: hypothetical protein DCC71_15455 [Pseudomonadota bacterium]